MNHSATPKISSIARCQVLFALMVGAVLLAGCDQSSQNVTPIPGDSYVIRQAGSAVGDANTNSLLPDGETPTVIVPDTVQYYVQGYTKDKDYNWSVNDQTPPLLANASQTHIWEDRIGADGDGDSEFLTVVYDNGDPITTVPGQNPVEVSAVNSDGSDDGIDAEILQVQAVIPEIDDQLGRLSGLETVASLVNRSELAGALKGLDDVTLLAPQTSALGVEQIGGIPTQATDDDEDPSLGVLNQFLRYHATAQEVSSSDLPVQDVPTLLGDTEVTNLTTGPLTRADLPVSNGTVHKLDTALFPPTALVDFTDRAVDDTTVTEDATVDSLLIDGSYFPDEGGYVVLHEGSAQGPIVGNSEYLEGPGISNEVKVGLDKDFNSSAGDIITLVAIPHEEASGNESFAPGSDPAYELSGSAVTDEAELEVEGTGQ